MSARLAGANDREKLEALCRKTYKDQAVWFLNGFWEKLGAEKEAVVIYEYVKKCYQLDLDKKAEGNELDELQAHRFLESFQKTLTVQSMRDQLRKTGAIGDKIKNVPLSHLLLVLYNVNFKDLINASQGNQDEIEKAQKLLEAVNTALRESEAKAEAARQALKEAENREAAARASEEQAKQREVEAKQREAESLVAKQELEAALAELKAQEDAYNNKTEDLKRKSEEGTVVQKNKAKNELAQHLAEDPLPLRRAKINQEAAVRKAERTAKAAAEARAASEQARKDAEKARDAAVAARTAAERAVDAADAAVEEARSRVAEAEAYLEEAKSKPGGQGSLWWIGQELHEAKAYLPASKGGYAKKKVF